MSDIYTLGGSLQRLLSTLKINRERVPLETLKSVYRVPYEELKSITVVTKEGEEIPILLDGRFVLPGTEILNEPLKNL